MKKFINKSRDYYGCLSINAKVMLIFFVVTLSVTFTVGLFLYYKAADMVEDEATATLLGMLDQTAIGVNNIQMHVEDTCFRMYTSLGLRAVFQRDSINYAYRQQVADYFTLVDIYSANRAD